MQTHRVVPTKARCGREDGDWKEEEKKISEMEGVKNAAKAENLKILFETAQKAIQAYQEARKGEPSTPEIPPIEKNGALVSNEEEEKSNKEEDTSGKKRQESAGKSQANWKKKKNQNRGNRGGGRYQNRGGRGRYQNRGYRNSGSINFYFSKEY
ncbi:uncharacterized protein LOC123270297 isoform X1 [Cotesia glomerata]|uniref:uncharacterized protein LOC123270297 isoform X1 n=2 Tax=Cotesia glomerata TaxID=32391 RepID=UPI001D0066CD|nr:uncharacterized protein LOC123270297 isoform X1 [Cotesia glomerata]